MAQGDVHVVPQSDQWAVKEENADVAVSSFGTQEEAWQMGKEMARQRGTEALLHGSDGQIRERNTYGSDPRDIQG